MTIKLLKYNRYRTRTTLSNGTYISTSFFALATHTDQSTCGSNHYSVCLNFKGDLRQQTTCYYRHKSDESSQHVYTRTMLSPIPELALHWPAMKQTPQPPLCQPPFLPTMRTLHGYKDPEREPGQYGERPSWSTESSLAGRGSCLTAYVFVRAERVSTSPSQKVPGSACALRGKNGISDSPVVAYQMLSALQAEPVDYCCRWIVAVEGSYVYEYSSVEGEKARHQVGGVVKVLLRCELSGGQERLPSVVAAGILTPTMGLADSKPACNAIWVSRSCRCVILCAWNGIQGDSVNWRKSNDLQVMLGKRL